MAQDWIEVQIASSVDSGELLGLLDDPTVTGAWQEDGVIRLYWPADRWNQETLQELRRVVQRLGDQSGPTGSPAVMINRLPDRDWKELWASTVTPIRIGWRIVIRPSWALVALRPHEFELVIDPKQAFGTGRHATTQVLAEWLEDLIQGGESLLDVGTGSGILAMLALRLGAKRALGIDHDPVAIDCARGYAAANGFGPELELRTATLEDLKESEDKRFDLILANLDPRTLTDSAAIFRTYLAHGARLLLSGLLQENLQEVAAAFAAEGVCVRQTRERDGWLAMEIIVPESCEGSSG